MAWQDVVLAAGGFLIALGIIPTIKGPVKPPIATSLTIAAVLVASFVAFVSLRLWLTAFGCALQAVLWGTVLAQSLIARREAESLAHPIVTTPDLGFEDFAPPVETPP